MTLCARILDNKFFILFISAIVMLVSGLQYIFGVFAPQLKTIFNYSQTEINLIGTLGNFGIYLAILPGIMFDKFGPRTTLIMGAALLLIGYALVWLAADTQFVRSPFLLGVFLFVAGHGGGCGLATMASCSVNFDKKQVGKVLGLLLACFGMSTALFSQFYRWFFSPDAVKLLFFLSVSTSSVLLIGSFFVDYTEAAKIKIAEDKLLKQTEEIENKYEDEVILSTSNKKKVEWSDNETKISDSNSLIKEPYKNPEMTYFQAMKTLNLWLIFISLGIVGGGGLVFLNNAGTLVIALGGKEGGQTTLITMFSIINSFTRMFAGFLSDRLSNHLSRPFFFLFASIFMTIGMVYMAFANLKMLYFGVIIVGVAFGTNFALMPVLVSELFSRTYYFAGIFGIIKLAPGIGSLIFATLLAGKLYDIEAEKQGVVDCIGQVCFRNIFLLCGFFCFLSGLLSFFLFWRTRENYRRIRNALKEEEETTLLK
eukprot:TRINITY_DN7523_c0_g1_i1.p1 TRINITY_DN7523_c0_g1~~TRINITY_DN7523_c0_g1_i1.p1  ORF type:complete len:482 (-),score=105.48 TRINITY_DN7523_c0_g1_i1:62-1507(-)